MVLLGSELRKIETDPVIPVNQDVNLKKLNGLVYRSGPGETQSMNEPSALLTLKTYCMENAALGPVGPDENLIRRDEAGDRSEPAASRSETDRPVWTDEGGDVPNYSVDPDVLLTGQLEIVTRPHPVGPHSRQEQSVSLGLDADQGEHIPTYRGHAGVQMFRAQPVADGPAGPNRTRRPVGTDEIHVVRDDVRPTAAVGQLPAHSPLKNSKISSPDDSYQPLFTGPVGTNEMDAVNDRSRPTASGPLGRQYSLDPLGPRAMLSLGDGNQPPSVGLVGRPWIPEQPGNQDTNYDNKRTILTRSESESDTGTPDSMVQTESDAQTGRANIGVANGPTDLNVIPSSSDSAVRSLGKQLIQTKSELKGVADVPDPVPQTGSEVQTDSINIRTNNGQTDWRETSLSSDSGVHSWTEQWENQEDSGRVSHLEFRAPPNTEEEDDSDYSDADGMLAMKLGGCPSEETYGQDDRILHSATTEDEFRKKGRHRGTVGFLGRVVGIGG